jgi:hypothetical protein
MKYSRYVYINKYYLQYRQWLLQDSQTLKTLKYDHESCGTRNQEWLCWRGPAVIYPTDRPTVPVVFLILVTQIFVLETFKVYLMLRVIWYILLKIIHFTLFVTGLYLDGAQNIWNNAKINTFIWWGSCLRTRPPTWSSGQFLATDPEVPDLIPGASRFSEKQRVWNGVHSASWGQQRSYLQEKVATPV